VFHGEEVGDRLAGVVGGTSLVGLVPEAPQTINVIEAITGRQLDPFGRSLVAMATELPGRP
jgi:hypothetical protein